MRRTLLSAWLLAWIALAAGCGTPAVPVPDTNTPLPTPQASPSTMPVPAEEPTPERPFVAQAGLRPAKAARGDTVELTVEGRTAPGWHIYAARGPRGLGIPTALECKLPEGLAPAGEWHYPESRPAPDGQGAIYEGRFQFHRALHVAENAPLGPIDIQCVVRYQACDPFRCRPAENQTLAVRGEVVPSR